MLSKTVPIKQLQKAIHPQVDLLGKGGLFIILLFLKDKDNSNKRPPLNSRAMSCFVCQCQFN